MMTKVVYGNGVLDATNQTIKPFVFPFANILFWFDFINNLVYVCMYVLIN